MQRGSASFTAPIDSDSSSPLQSSSFSPTNRERKEGDVRRRRVSDTRVVSSALLLLNVSVGKEEEKQKGAKNMKHSNLEMQQKLNQLLKCELHQLGLQLKCMFSKALTSSLVPCCCLTGESISEI